MRKSTLVLLMVLLLFATLFACGEGESTTADATSTESTSETTAETTTEMSIDTTTEVPITTTEAPVTTTKAPVTTTKAPVTTTEAPQTEPVPQYSEGLEWYYNMGKNTYEVKGIGRCKDEVVKIPPTYEGGKVVRVRALACDAKEIVVPEGVESIADFAFRDCPNLEKVVLPKSLKTIGYALFRNCPSMKSIAFEGNAVYETAGNSIIEKATKRLTSATVATVIPDDGSVLELGFSSFSELPIERIIIPEGVTTIHQYAFSGCDRLKTVSLPDSLREIGMNALNETAYYLDETNWQNGVLYLGKHLIKVSDGISELTILEGTISIAGGAFEWADVKKLVLPDSMRGISEQAFSYAALEEITLNEGLEVVGTLAFQNSAVSVFVIPASVVKVGSSSFSSLGLTAIYCKAKEKPDGWADDWIHNPKIPVWGYTEEE